MLINDTKTAEQADKVKRVVFADRSFFKIIEHYFPLTFL